MAVLLKRYELGVLSAGLGAGSPESGPAPAVAECGAVGGGFTFGGELLLQLGDAGPGVVLDLGDPCRGPLFGCRRLGRRLLLGGP